MDRISKRTFHENPFFCRRVISFGRNKGRKDRYIFPNIPFLKLDVSIYEIVNKCSKFSQKFHESGSLPKDSRIDGWT